MAPRIPSLNWLRVFEAAARTGSFLRAAEQLNMSAPAVSQQIKALEAALGTTLFTRGARSVALTDAGRAFLPTVLQSLSSVENAAAHLFSGAEAQAFTLQCSLLLGVGWLGPRLAEFTRCHTDIRVSVLSGVQETDFDPAKSDLRIVFGLPPGPNEEADVLFGETIFPVARPEVASQITCPEDLLAHQLIDIPAHRANWWRFLPMGAQQAKMLYVDNSVLALSLASGDGIALARWPACGDLPEQFGLQRCFAIAPLPGVQSFSLVHYGKSELRSAAALFRDWLLKEARAATHQR